MPIFLCQRPIRSSGTGTALGGIVCLTAWLVAGSHLWAGSPPQTNPHNRQADAEQGRAIFNGKGLCSTCHGVDGHRDQFPPELSSHIRENIQRLSPAPTDLRQADTLTLTTDKQRFEAIRHGHLRTAMYPLSKGALSDEDILALLPYLASIRGPFTRADPTPAPATPLRGDAAQGRQLFHELGGCAICHGIEGHLDRRPSISKDLAQRLDALPAPPANLRDPAALKSQTDEDRFLSIKRGHPGTAMYPKTLLRDDDIRDLVAYLATLLERGR